MPRSQPLRATPKLYARRLGYDLYSPAHALAQLVANSLDAEAGEVRINLVENDMGSVEQLVVEDDGFGITPNRFAKHFRDVGVHYDALPEPRRATMGSKGIGRLAIFRLGYSAEWSTVADEDGNRLQLSWTMTADNPSPHRIAEASSTDRTGTRVAIHVFQEPDSALSRCLNEQMILRELFNIFASSVLQRDQSEIYVNTRRLDVDEFVERSEVEDLPADLSSQRPGGTLRHLVVQQQVRANIRPRSSSLVAVGRTKRSRSPG